MKKKKHSELFYQYLFSYVVILLLPLIVLSLFVYSYVLNVLKEEIYSNNVNALQKVQNTVEAHLQNITSLEHKVYLDSILEGFVLMNDTMAAIDTKQELEKYQQSSQFLIDIAYYQEEDQYIVAASSSCLKEDFWEKMYRWENWNYEKFQQDLKENNGSFFIEAQNVIVKNKHRERIITLVIPLDAKRCVIMLVEEDFFTNMMPQTDLEKGVSAIVDINGRTIISKGESSLIEAVYDKAADDKKSNVITIQGNKYLRSSVYSESYQWNYESMILISSIEEKVLYVRLLMVLICFFVCCAGTLGIIYFMKRNYIPIHTLEIASNEIIKNEENKNEIDHVKKVLEYLRRQNQKLKDDELKSKYALKERFVMKWLSGMYENTYQIKEQASGFGIMLDKEFYQAVIIRMCKSLLGKTQQIEDILIKATPDNIRVVVRVQAEVEKIFVIVGYDNGQKACAEQFFLECIQSLQCEMESTGWLVLGRPVHKCEDLKKSYKEALKALEYCIIFDDTNIVSYDEVVSWAGNGMLDIQPKRLENYIRNRDVVGLENFLRTTLSEMKNKKMDIRQIRMFCNELIYVLEKTIVDVNRDCFVENPLYENISGILQFDTVQELIEMINLISCDIIEHLNEMDEKSIAGNLLDYIKKNCYSAGFSTTFMAEEFEMSLSYLSKYFKKYVGKNLSDYVMELKIEKAKELLRNEDMPIKDIAEKVGYYSVNSFNRRFKQITGHTPGEYRELN